MPRYTPSFKTAFINYKQLFHKVPKTAALIFFFRGIPKEKTVELELLTLNPVFRVTFLMTGNPRIMTYRRHGTDSISIFAESVSSVASAIYAV